MWFLYLDESGDLGFDFVSREPSRYFTVAVVAVSDIQRNAFLLKAAKKTLKRKLNPRRKRKRIVVELKGSKTTLEVKKYLFNQIKDIKFGIYSITLRGKSAILSQNREKGLLEVLS